MLHLKARGLNSVPSRHRANSIPANFLASATQALPLPRLAAILIAQSYRAAFLALRYLSSAHAASTSKVLARLPPALLMRPLRWRSPELYSRGTNPG